MGQGVTLLGIAKERHQSGMPDLDDEGEWVYVLPLSSLTPETLRQLQ